jgi:tRNA threonylcarbamoyladenosine biosynthesis protein TsaB
LSTAIRCLYNNQGNEVEPVAARIIDQDTFNNHLADHRVVFFGSGMEKCRDLLSHPNAFFIADVHPHSSSLALLAEEIYAEGLFENIAYFEPFYLKDFVTTQAKNKITNLK